MPGVGSGIQVFLTYAGPMQRCPPQCGKRRLLKFITVEHGVRVDWNQPLSIGMSDGDASLPDGAQVEALCINEYQAEFTLPTSMS